VRSSALAVFTLITSSNLVGCSTGRSAGLAPLRMRQRPPNCGPGLSMPRLRSQARSMLCPLSTTCKYSPSKTKSCA
jgi:hypothetical protein